MSDRPSRARNLCSFVLLLALLLPVAAVQPRVAAAQSQAAPEAGATVYHYEWDITSTASVSEALPSGGHFTYRREVAIRGSSDMRYDPATISAIASPFALTVTDTMFTETTRVSTNCVETDTYSHRLLNPTAWTGGPDPYMTSHDLVTPSGSINGAPPYLWGSFFRYALSFLTTGHSVVAAASFDTSRKFLYQFDSTSSYCSGGNSSASEVREARDFADALIPLPPPPPHFDDLIGNPAGTVFSVDTVYPARASGLASRSTPLTTHFRVTARTGPCDPCLTVDAFDADQQDVPTGEWAAVPDQGTIDGNEVRLTVKVGNHGAAARDVAIVFRDADTGNTLKDAVFQRTLAGFGTATAEYRLDTAGLAWDADGAPHPRRPVKVAVMEGSTERANRTKDLRVRPRPVVLVHGLWSDASTWASYQGFLAGVRDDWRAYAVGDGQGPGVMNTGVMTNPLKRTNTIAQNAQVLAGYLQRVREIEDAQHVDIVAHSMGGLISRQYIQALMPVARDNRPAVSHLVMLGTPNGGSPCADALMLLTPPPSQPAIYQLTTGYAAAFNAAVTNTRGVRLSILAGNPFDVTCTDLTAPGDGVVPVTSAVTGYLDRELTASHHLAMTASPGDFQSFVRPHLAVGQSPAAQEAAPPASAAVPGVQGLGGATRQVPPGGTVDVAVAVPAATAFGVTLAAPPGVASALVAPGGVAIDPVAAGGGRAAEPFRTHRVESPPAGAWAVRLQNTGGVTVSVAVSAWAVEPSPRLVATIGTPAPDRRVAISATLTDGGAPVAGATVTATLTDAATGQETALRLIAAPGGGYAAQSGVLAEGDYAVQVRATKADATRTWAGSLRVGSPAQAVGLTLSSSVGGQARRDPASGFPATGTTVTLTAIPEDGDWIFAGWVVDNVPRGWAPAVTLTMDGPHTVHAAFARRPSFPDVTTQTTGATEAIAQLAARGIIRGYADGTFGPADPTLRAQMAALIVRAMGWGGESAPTPFSDRDGVDDELWRAIGVLAAHGVAKGYGDGTYGTTAPVLNAQVISFITRAMVDKGYWTFQPDDGAIYPDVAAASGHRQDLATYVHYAGAVRGADNTAGDFVGWDQPASRAWFSFALWQALDSFFGADRVP